MNITNFQVFNVNVVCKYKGIYCSVSVPWVYHVKTKWVACVGINKITHIFVRI